MRRLEKFFPVLYKGANGTVADECIIDLRPYRRKEGIAPPLSLNIRIIESAFDDLDDGAAFYERLGEGLGSYFTSSLISDIDSLKL